MPDPPDPFPINLLRRLVERGVDFVAIGGVALTAHGSARHTDDLDICYSNDPVNLDLLGAVLVELGAKLRGVDEDVPFVPDGRTLRRTGILTLDTAEGPIDLLLQPAGAPPYEDLRRRAVRMDLGGFGVLVASLDDLAAMKRAAGRPIDLVDLEEIEVIRRLTEGG
ncbi:MAG TPA: nucleotidyl transferase AbiEii/AbiGii toxin family protein [Solirubrobacteraceae bacterium]|nr:nucleotidyl transferase AbiEii/AbiGii toxin family protein [Solirubrobacteraceae bacterium]